MIEHGRQIARYCAVGLGCLALSTALLAFLCEVVRLNYSVAFALCFVCSNAIGFWLNARYTFSIRKPLDRAALFRYMIVAFILLLVNSVLLRMLVESLHLWYLTATFVLAALNAPATFIAHRLISYRLGRADAVMS